MYSLRSARPPFNVLFLRNLVWLASVAYEWDRDSPSVSSKICELSCQWQYLHLRRDGHLIMGVKFAMAHKGHKHIRRGNTSVKVCRDVVGVDVLSFGFEMRLAHFAKRPCRRRYHTLRTDAISKTSYKNSHDVPVRRHWQGRRAAGQIGT